VLPLVCACIATLAACAPDDAAPSETEVSAPPSLAGATTEAQPVATAPTTVAAPVELVAVYGDVHFYPACGNETLDHGGVTWYPIVHVGFDPMMPELQPRVDEVLAVRRQAWSPDDPHGIARVVEPGPGDDIGTLAVWADGVARWTSASGDLDVWMVDDDIEYRWEC
jgi:hypothetical protein